MSRRVSFSNRRNVLSRGASGAILSSSIVRPRPNAVNPNRPCATLRICVPPPPLLNAYDV